MEYKHYILEGDIYALKNNGTKIKAQTIKILAIMFLALIGLIFVLNYPDWSGPAIIALIGGLLILLAYFVRLDDVYIQPSSRSIILKRKEKIHKQYNFNQFLNFQRIQVKKYGVITIRWRVEMYVDDNSKKKRITLGSGNEKIVNEIIAETSTLMNLKK